MLEYLALFFASLLAATILPASSEVLLFALLKQGMAPTLLVLTATIGNTLGSWVNWLLGRCLLRFQHRKWFYFKPSQIARGQRGFQRYGQWTLLFAWLPVVGDALTLVAGILRVHWLPFLILVATGKSIRYIAIAYWAMPET